jgi:hypothetical protein
MTLVCWGVSPLLAAWSVLAKIDVLPYPFSLFHTHDNTLDGGQKQGYRIGAKGLELWWQRTRWICRNPCYGLNAYPLGFNHEGYSVLSETEMGDFSKRDASYFNLMKSFDGKKYFSYRRNIPLWRDWYLKVWLGWNYVAYGGVRHQLKTHIGSLKRAK